MIVISDDTILLKKELEKEGEDANSNSPQVPTKKRGRNPPPQTKKRTMVLFIAMFLDTLS